MHDNFDLGAEFHVQDKGRNVWMPMSFVGAILAGAIWCTAVVMRVVSTFETRSTAMEAKLEELKQIVTRRVVTREQAREFVHEVRQQNPSMAIPNLDDIALRLELRDK
jgi:hypothetical protein